MLRIRKRQISSPAERPYVPHLILFKNVLEIHVSYVAYKIYHIFEQRERLLWLLIELCPLQKHSNVIELVSIIHVRLFTIAEETAYEQSIQTVLRNLRFAFFDNRTTCPSFITSKKLGTSSLLTPTICSRMYSAHRRTESWKDLGFLSHEIGKLNVSPDTAITFQDTGSVIQKLQKLQKQTHHFPLQILQLTSLLFRQHQLKILDHKLRSLQILIHGKLRRII